MAIAAGAEEQSQDTQLPTPAPESTEAAGIAGVYTRVLQRWFTVRFSFFVSAPQVFNMLDLTRVMPVIRLTETYRTVLIITNTMGNRFASEASHGTVSNMS